MTIRGSKRQSQTTACVMIMNEGMNVDLMAAFEACFQPAGHTDLFSMRKTKLLDQQESCVFANTQVAASQLSVAVLTVNRAQHCSETNEKRRIWSGRGCEHFLKKLVCVSLILHISTTPTQHK